MKQIFSKYLIISNSQYVVKVQDKDSITIDLDRLALINETINNNCENKPKEIKDEAATFVKNVWRQNK